MAKRPTHEQLKERESTIDLLQQRLTELQSTSWALNRDDRKLTHCMTEVLAALTEFEGANSRLSRALAALAAEIGGGRGH